MRVRCAAANVDGGAGACSAFRKQIRACVHTVCVLVCMCACVCACVRVCVCLCVTRLEWDVYEGASVFIFQAFMYKYRTCVHTSAGMRICSRACVCAYMRVYVCVCMRVRLRECMCGEDEFYHVHKHVRAQTIVCIDLWRRQCQNTRVVRSPHCGACKTVHVDVRFFSACFACAQVKTIMSCKRE